MVGNFKFLQIISHKLPHIMAALKIVGEIARLKKSSMEKVQEEEELRCADLQGRERRVALKD